MVAMQIQPQKRAGARAAGLGMLLILLPSPVAGVAPLSCAFGLGGEARKTS
jgi:hypothetical protein